MLLKLPDFLRPTCILPFLEPFFDPVMIIRSIRLLQIKFPIAASKCCLWPYSFAIASTGRVVLWFCVQEHRKAQPAVTAGSGFKASQKTGPRFKASADRPGEAGNRTCDPWFTRHKFYPLQQHLNVFSSKCIFVAVFLGCTSTGRVGLCFLWFYVQELPKVQPAVVLVLKCLRRQGIGLKSHPHCCL